MAENNERLFDQFPEVSYAEWRAKVEADLKGADFNKKLVWRTNEGFSVEPVYRAEDIAGLGTTDTLPGQYPYVRGTRARTSWPIPPRKLTLSLSMFSEKASILLASRFPTRPKCLFS